jgi:hypothetical protein
MVRIEIHLDKTETDILDAIAKEELERFREEWMKAIHDQHIRICRNTVIEPVNVLNKTHIKVFVTKTNVFRAQIFEPNKPMYEVTVGGENWNKGLGQEHTEEIQRKCWKLIGSLSEQLTRFE